MQTRFKVASLHKSSHDEPKYLEELQKIVRIDAEAGGERTNVTRTIAARSALVLSEQLYQQFAGLPLKQPFETSLQEKKKRMDLAIDSLGHLVDYQVGDVTAAATFYMAEVYHGFSRALLESERPAGLQAGELKEYELGLEDEALPFEDAGDQVLRRTWSSCAPASTTSGSTRVSGELAGLMPALCEGRDQQRVPWLDRPLRIPAPVPPGAARHESIASHAAAGRRPGRAAGTAAG